MTSTKLEKILKKRGRGTNKQYFLKWLGYSNKFNPASVFVFFTCTFTFTMSGTHFDLTLLSDASFSTFPDDKTTSYRVKLRQTIDLNGDLEVGLFFISYLNTWDTLKNYDSHVYYSDDGIFFTSTTTPMEYGYYDTMQNFIKAFNKAVSKEVNDNIKLTFNARIGKVTVT